MIQLSYQPAFDPFHTVFRLLRLMSVVRAVGSLPKDQVRTLDFYLLFPYRAAAIRWLPAHARFRKLAKTLDNHKPYGEQPDDVVMFSRMEPIQKASLGTLAEKGFIDLQLWRAGCILPTDMEVPEGLKPRVEEANKEEAQLMELLHALGAEYQLLGQGGLKDRTGLLEYRYDAV